MGSNTGQIGVTIAQPTRVTRLLENSYELRLQLTSEIEAYTICFSLIFKKRHELKLFISFLFK